jgi:hypothetical protein
MKFAPVRALLAVIQISLLLTVQLGEGAGMHHCPEHDAGVGATMPGMAGHMGHHRSSGQTDHSSCHCVGACCQATLACGTVAPIVLLRTIAPLALPESAPVASLRDTVRLLPFAIGPPAIA